MKKVVITFGLISGAVISLMMLLTIPFMDSIGFENGAILGYTTMVLSFLLVYFGVRSYRDNVAGGTITFAKAFTTGILITLISCACYVVTWEFIYFNFMPDFLDKYLAHTIETAKAAGASSESIQTQIKEFDEFKALYQNPFFNVAMTFIEPFPVGLIMTLISAAMLRKSAKQKMGS